MNHLIYRSAIATQLSHLGGVCSRLFFLVASKSNYRHGVVSLSNTRGFISCALPYITINYTITVYLFSCRKGERDQESIIIYHEIFSRVAHLEDLLSSRTNSNHYTFSNFCIWSPSTTGCRNEVKCLVGNDKIILHSRPYLCLPTPILHSNTQNEFIRKYRPDTIRTSTKFLHPNWVVRISKSLRIFIEIGEQVVVVDLHTMTIIHFS